MKNKKLSLINSGSIAKKIFLGFALLTLFGICVYPFFNLILKVVYPRGEFSLQYILSVFEHRGAIRAFKNTILVSFAISLLSVIIAVPIAWVLTRTDLPKAKLFRSLFCLPYAIPPYIGAMAWIYLANPSTGLLNRFLGFSFFNIYSYGGLIFVMTTFLFTFVLLGVLTSLDRMDSSFEEAARLSGATKFQVFSQITLPLIKPAILSSSLLVFLGSAASFGVPALIGNPAKIYLVTTQIYTFQKMGSMKGIYQASALSILLLVFALLLLFANQWFLRNKQFRIVGGKSSRPSLLPLNSLKYPVLVALVLALIALFFLPLTGIAITAFSKLQGRFEISNFGFDNFERVFFEISETGRAFKNSTLLGVIAASLATGLAVLLSYVQWKTRLKGRHMLDVFASFPYSIPGTVVALALILAFSHSFFGIGPSLYNTLTMLWLAYVIKYLSLSMKTVGEGFCQIDDSLAEAARVSGASWTKTLSAIWLPLLKPSIVASWFLIFMPAFSELTMTILLTGPGTETLGTLIFQLQEYADPSGGSSAVLALVVVLFVLVVNSFIKLVSKGKYGL